MPDRIWHRERGAFMPSRITKFIVVGFIILFAVFLDQWTKNWAEDNLASMRYADHVATVTVSADAGELPLSEYIAKRYPKNDESEQRRMVAMAQKDGAPLSGSDIVRSGDKIDLGHASITVIPGYYDYQYARNPGAAWSFMADKPEKFRTIFFGVTGVLAVILLLAFIARSAWPKQRMLIITLGCVLGGAAGNIIDRFRYGYVIDFISWHIGDKYWPTFNIADVFVTCGVVFLVIDLLIHRDEKAPETAKIASESPKSSEGLESPSDVAKDEKSSDAAKAEETSSEDAKAEESSVETCEVEEKTLEGAKAEESSVAKGNEKSPD